jgi:MFS family permease
VLRAEEKAPAKTAVRPSFRWGSFHRDFRLFLVISGVFALGNSSDVFLILRVKDLGFTTTATLLVYVLYNIVFALASYPAGAVSDRLGQRKVYLGGLVVFALVYGGFAWAHQSWHIWGLFAIYGLYTALTDGVSKALAANLAGAEQRATALGLYHAVTGGLALPAGLVAGRLWQAWGPAAAFQYGAVMATAAAVLLGGLYLWQKALREQTGVSAPPPFPVE